MRFHSSLPTRRMPLLRLDSASLNYGTLILLDSVDFSISRGHKIGLLGRNGTGKTSLLKILAGELLPESGERWMRPGTRIAWLQQTLPEADDQTVYDVVASGLAETGRLLAEYHHLLQHDDLRPTSVPCPASSSNWRHGMAGACSNRWRPRSASYNCRGKPAWRNLSGGWRRRVALGPGAGERAGYSPSR